MNNQMSAAQRMRAQAVHDVRELQLDKLVRHAAELGKFDGTANWEHRHDAGPGRGVLVIRSSTAGTRTASVRIDAGTVYECHDRDHLVTYRAGWWVAVIQDLADQRVRAATVDRVVAEDQQLAREVANFTPLPD